MKKTLFILFSLILAGITMLGQNIEPVEIGYFNSNAYSGKVSITQDVKIENFMETYVGLNKKRRCFYGYRVKIYAQNNQNARSEANAIRLL